MAVKEFTYPRSIKEWPEDDRPREKLLRHGAESLSSAELLAIILRTGERDRSAVDLAKGIVATYGDFMGLEGASIEEVSISEGCLTSSIVHPREVFTPVVKDSAAAVILVHNHPSGDPTPSREDREVTKRLQEVGELLGVKVLDHIVIGSGRYVSFADEGLL